MSELAKNARKIARAIALTATSAVIKLRRPSVPRQTVIYHAWPDFARKCEAIAALLRARGLASAVRTGTSIFDRVQVRDSSELHIGFWNNFPAEFMPDRFVFFNAEPLHAARWARNEAWFAQMRNAIEVWDYSSSNLPIHRTRNNNARIVPFGYAPYYETKFAESLAGVNHEQDIDVLFVGSLSPRRQVVLDGLRDAGVRLHTVTNQNPQYGRQLDRTIARAKILLSLFYHDEPETHVADFARLDHLLSNRRFIVHERLSDSARDPDFERAVVTAPYDQIVDACVTALERRAARDERAQESYEWFRRERAIDNFIPYETIALAARS